MIKKIIVLSALLTSCVCTSWASGAEEDPVLISEDFVRYFKTLATKESRPITLHVNLKDLYGTNEVEDEKTLAVETFPRDVTQRFVLSSSEALTTMLSLFKGSGELQLEASITVNAPGHKEKVNGFGVLKRG